MEKDTRVKHCPGFFKSYGGIYHLTKKQIIRDTRGFVDSYITDDQAIRSDEEEMKVVKVLCPEEKYLALEREWLKSCDPKDLRVCYNHYIAKGGNDDDESSLKGPMIELF